MIIPCCHTEDTCQTISWVVDDLPDAETEDFYSVQLVPLGVAYPYQIYLVSGELPPGLTLSDTGLISGTPTENGDFTFTVQVSDANRCSGEKTFTITVDFPVVRITEGGDIRITEDGKTRIID